MSRNELSVRQQRFAVAYVGCRSLKEACQVARVSEATAKRWLKQPAMQQYVRTLAQQQLEQILGHLRQAALVAVATLQQTMVDPAAPWPSKVSAANSVLSHLLKLTEQVDIEQRLSALETLVEQQGKTA
ncbi:hypothetical protein [Thermorudis peleae]|uniref:hypothetical protein n=1 Tax=Thermorudis peleae TaxID=1382356 RepID=UPI0005706771|nr:hypothetical protein [Thermorudis peleae]